MENKRLTKADIIERLAKRGYTKRDASVIIDDFVGMLAEGMINGESFVFQNFGTFIVKEAAEKRVDSFQIGVGNKRVVVPAHKTVKWVPCNALRTAVREGFKRE